MTGLRDWVGAWPTDELNEERSDNRSAPLVSAVWVLAGFVALAVAALSSSGGSERGLTAGGALAAILFGALFYLSWRASSRRDGWVHHVGLLAAIGVLAVSASKIHNGPLAVAVLSLFAPLAALVCSSMSFRWSMAYLGAICVALNLSLLSVHPHLPGIGPLLSLVAVSSGLIVGSTGARTRRSAMTDPMTGLPNRRAMELVARHQIASAGRSGQQLALVVLSLHRGRSAASSGPDYPGGSGFGRRKQFEQWMREIAGTWAWMLRGADVIGRIEGDEFVLMLTGCDHKGVFTVVDRLLAVTDYRGVGGATGFYPGDTFETMLERAERSLRDAIDLDPGQIVMRSDGDEVATTFARVTGRESQLVSTTEASEPVG